MGLRDYATSLSCTFRTRHDLAPSSAIPPSLPCRVLNFGSTPLNLLPGSFIESFLPLRHEARLPPGAPTAQSRTSCNRVKIPGPHIHRHLVRQRLSEHFLPSRPATRSPGKHAARFVPCSTLAQGPPRLHDYRACAVSPLVAAPPLDPRNASPRLSSPVKVVAQASVA